MTTLFDREHLEILRRACERLDTGFSRLPDAAPAEVPGEALEAVLLEVAERLHDNYPYFHPLYAGQMLKPPHPVARLAYALAMTINPNNHALDGGRASSAMEKEAVAAIARMFGWTHCLGHLTSGGTFANLEALFVSGQIHPGKAIAASAQAHYTHGRISAVLRIPFVNVPSDDAGRLDIRALEGLLDREAIGTVVATMGATATGAVDPLPEILALCTPRGIRVHADAAYGGYHVLAGNLGEATRRKMDALGRVDSIVIDPHKHGLQPYGCGCVLFRDPAVGRFYKHESPYTYFSSGDLHLGEISLECSRAGAAAVALWATQRLLPPEPGGDFARGLEDGRRAALELDGRIRADGRFLASEAPPELDIVVFIPRADSVEAASARSRRIFEEAARRNLHLALAELPLRFFGDGDELATALSKPGRERTVTALRSVLMKPSHHDWVDRIWQLLDEAVGASN